MDILIYRYHLGKIVNKVTHMVTQTVRDTVIINQGDTHMDMVTGAVVTFMEAENMDMLIGVEDMNMLMEVEDMDILMEVEDMDMLP